MNRRIVLSALAWTLLSAGIPALAQSVPAGYPVDYGKVVSAAKAECIAARRAVLGMSGRLKAS